MLTTLLDGSVPAIVRELSLVFLDVLLPTVECLFGICESRRSCRISALVFLVLCSELALVFLEVWLST